MNRKLLILARAIDHRVGKDDYDAPDIPILTQYEAWTAFTIKLSIILVNFITCGFIIANTIRHWWNMSWNYRVVKTVTKIPLGDIDISYGIQDRKSVV